MYKSTHRVYHGTMADQQLPEPECLYLRSLSSDLPALRHRVSSLRANGWTLRAIGEAFSPPVRRSTVRSWETHPASSPSSSPAPPLPAPPSVRPSPSLPAPAHAPQTRALPIDPPLAVQERIRALAPLARRVRGGTPPASPFRQAKDELDALVAAAHARGTPVQRLAEIAGVSYRAMKVRIDEYNNNTAHPHTDAS